jgi:8-oxo-dGTP diphosphatase
MESPVQKQLIAVRAVIVRDGRVLVIRESRQYEEGTKAGKYDFPGGRVKPGENLFDALKREAMEECGLEVKIIEPFYVDEWTPVIKGEVIQIVGIFFKCEAMSKEVKLGSDHDDYRWVEIGVNSGLPLMKETESALAALNR